MPSTYRADFGAATPDELAAVAGLEVATGIPVLTTRPEECAAHLRAALPVDVMR